ncbi:MAG: DUF126 domain-containing protein [Gemmatimonadetes bacterium]|nr:DUF126 domain-containing protein [Gemmatimonadota bacterium]
MPDTVRVLHAGAASGRTLVLSAPLSFWGGLDPETGRIIDRRHPQCGARVSGRILALPDGRGSSSSSTVLAEAIRRGTAPAAILMREPDSIIVLGALVATELYAASMPVLHLDAIAFAAIHDGAFATIEPDGSLHTSEAADHDAQ